MKSICIALLVAVGIAGQAVAGSNLWTPAGPDGGIMTVIATDPTSSSVLYAGASHGGIWKSTDAGASWKAVGTGALIASTINSIAISPSLPSTLYIAVEQSGAWRSTDGGSAWTQTNNGFILQSGIVPIIHGLAVDSSHSTIVYAGAEGSESNGGLYKSTDGGAHWKLANSGLPVRFNLRVEIVRIDPTDSTDIFVATGNDGVYRSTDSGSSWTKFCDNTLDETNITDLLPFPVSNTVFAAAAGLYQSSSTAPSVIEPEAQSFLDKYWADHTADIDKIFVHYPLLLLALPTDENGNPVVRSEVVAPPLLYVASLDNGMAVSTDGAQSWSLINTGLPSFNFRAAAVNRKDQRVVYTGGQGDGVYKTTNAGSNWSPSSHGLQAASVNVVAVAPSNPSVIYAGLTIVGGLRASTDGGATWSIANGSPNTLGNLTVSSIAVDPTNPAVVYLTASGDTADAYKSTDGGGHWLKTSSGFDHGDPIRFVAVARTIGSILYATSVNKVYKSIDSGATWKEQTAATGLLQIPEIVAIDPNNSSTVYVTTNGNSVFRTTDGGATWAAANNDGGSGFFSSGAVHALAIDPSHTGTLYAGVDFRAIWKTTNGGALWVNLATGLQDQGGYASPVSIAIDPSDSKTVYAAASDSVGDPNLIGVFVSHDSGATWSTMSTGLTNLNATSLAIAPNGANSTLYLGTQGAGVQAFTITPPPKPRQAIGLGAGPIRHVGGRR